MEMPPWEFLYWCVIGILGLIVWANVRKGYHKALEPEDPPVPPTLLMHPVLGAIDADDTRWWGRIASDKLGYGVFLTGTGSTPHEDQVTFWLSLEERLPEILRKCPPFPEERCSSYGNSPFDFRPVNSKVEEIALIHGAQGLEANIALEGPGGGAFPMYPSLTMDRECRITNLEWIP